MGTRKLDIGTLRIRAAEENNLKRISLDIPHDTFAVVTGLSGSGKSSLAFDTVYAEGQRRYIETFSPYTRQFFDKVKKPHVDAIENVRPAIAIQQRTRVTGSRSTVGTLTDINDYLKIIWSNLARPVCPLCEVELHSYNPSELAEHLRTALGVRGDEGCIICAPIEVRSKTDLQNELTRLGALGFGRFINPESGAVELLEEVGKPELWRGHTLLVAIDRLSRTGFQMKRARESIEQAYSLSSGRCLVIRLYPKPPSHRPYLRVLNSVEQTNVPTLRIDPIEYRNTPGCSAQELRLAKPRPALFSFNHPLGACPECKGFGKVLQIDPVLCVPNPNLSIDEKALQCWSGDAARSEFRRLLAFCKSSGIPTDVPWHNLDAEHQEQVFGHKSREYRGVYHWFKRLERKAYKMHVRVFLARYRSQVECATCRGKRLKPEALAYRTNGLDLPALWQMPIAALKRWLEDLERSSESGPQLADVFKVALARLRFLEDLGLSYLTLDRQARTLSGGETQRVNLATALGSELVSTQFVLDEPSVGLHMRDTERLIASISKLHQRGNSVLVVEHDLDCIRAAEHIVELGPLAGEKGGEIVYNGPKDKWTEFDSAALIERALAQPEKSTASRCLSISTARVRNLKDLEVDIPLERFVCLSGVSGSGKSTLATEVVAKAFERYRLQLRPEPGAPQVKGFKHIQQMLLVDQSPLSKSPRANIATFTAIWDTVRDLLSRSEDARLRSLPRSAFSFNVDGGRCPECKGAGFIREDMQFLSDVYIPCEVCLGKRFQKVVLEVQIRGCNVDDFLNMSIERCAEILGDLPAVRSSAETLIALGLGHLTLGHPLSELSGGEAQRLKLVPFVAETGSSQALLVFDEPTTGLHWYDVQRLIQLLRNLCERGHSIVCIEHNPLVLLNADWVIDMGPEGGEGGGQVVLQGTPRSFLDASAASVSHTARCLSDFIRPDRSAVPRPTAARRLPPDSLRIEGAREHNLRNVNITLPLDSVVAVTGVSGSGKSTIAKDIIYAEGQRRYLDCLSPYARQFIKELKKPEMNAIHNVRPTVCVYQHTFQPGALSTVGTMSEVYNFMRLLYAKIGVQYCPRHPQQAISPSSAASIAADIKAVASQAVRLLAPLVKLKKGAHRQIFERALETEINEVRVDGVFGKPGAFVEGLAKAKAHTIEYVIARFNPRNMEQALIEETVSQGLGLSGGTLILHSDDSERTFSLQRACPRCGTGFFKPDPEDLSFHSRRGACQRCQGRGVDSKGKVCAACAGARISTAGRYLRLAARGFDWLNIHAAAELPPAELLHFLSCLNLSTRDEAVARPILNELILRLQALLEFGLDHLTMNRDCASLSGGELQRLRLAAAAGSPLSGVMYIFDEPSAGLHPNDNRKVMKRLVGLRDRGNSVLVIEHDTETIAECEHIIDVGPGGGRNGGEIVFNGSLAKFLQSCQSETAKAMRNELESPPAAELSAEVNHTLTVKTGVKNNIASLHFTLPLGRLLCVCGVSGAGKSSLVHGVISSTLSDGKRRGNRWSLGDHALEASCSIERIVAVDQSPIGRNSRSTPASYLGIWDEIRKLYAGSLEARTRGWNLSYFSYNTGKGRCAECKGQGQLRLEMSFLAEADVVCESCAGRRYSEEANSVSYLDRTISEVLEMTFDEARQHFSNHPRVRRPLHQACELGLGYLTLGQSSSTLSGGESQRIKLVSELSQPRKGHTLYLLDEPSTGLHRADVLRLAMVLRQLLAHGHTVLLIEHDRDLISMSDYLIELGPGPGAAGGKIIFQGPPGRLRDADTPWGRIFSSLTDPRAIAPGVLG